MTEPLTVNLGDLRSALSAALDLVEQQFGPEVDLDVDYYWHLRVEDAFDMSREPTSFTTGQTSDDIDDAIANKPERDPAEAWHDLSHLVGILRAPELRCRP